jgi:hypothetical protein
MPEAEAALRQALAALGVPPAGEATMDDLLALARSRAARSLTHDECRQYLHVEACPKQGRPARRPNLVYRSRLPRL